MKKSITWAGIITVMVMITALSAYGASAWPHFKGDAGNTGTVGHNIGVTSSTTWTFEVPEGPDICGAVLDGNGNIVFLTNLGPMYSVKSNGSDILWSYQDFSEDNWGTATYSDDNDCLYVTVYNEEPSLFKFNAANGDLIWSALVGYTSGSDNPPAIGPDGSIYVAFAGNWDDETIGLLAFTDNGTSATMKWSVNIGAGVGAGPIPIFDDSGDTLIYVATSSSPKIDPEDPDTEANHYPNLYCVRDDDTTGTVVWTALVGYNWLQGTVDSQGNYYIATFRDWTWFPYNVFKFDKTGNVVWRVSPSDSQGRISNSYQNSPTLSADESTIYYGSQGPSMVWALNNSDGSLKWNFECIGTSIVDAAPLVLQDGVLYVLGRNGADEDSIFYRLHDLGTVGIPVFKSTFAGKTFGATPCVADDGTLYVISTNSTVYAFTPEGDTVEILTTSVQNGTRQEEYYDYVTALGGDRPYTWTKDSGDLPPGIGINTDGEITGTPTTSGTYNFVVRVTDSSGSPTTDTVALSIEVDYPTFQITTLGLSLAEKDAAYSDTLTTNEAPLPITWSIVGGTPGPFSINSGTGEITGTPTSYGDNSFVVQAQDNDSPANTATKEVTISVPDPALWQMFQNNKRRTGTAVVIGPDEYVERWTYDIDLGNGAPAVEGNAVYQARGWGNVLHRLDALTGAAIWNGTESSWGHQRFTPPLGVGADSDHVYQAFQARVLCLSKTDGSVIWSTAFDGDPPFGISTTGNVAYSNGQIYGILGDYLKVIEDNGATEWTQSMLVHEELVGGLTGSEVALYDTVDNGEMMTFASPNLGLGIFGYKKDIALGWSPAWNNTTTDISIRQNACVSSTNTLFYAGKKGTAPAAVALDGLTGEILWSTILSVNEGHANRGSGCLSYDQKTYYVQYVGPMEFVEDIEGNYWQAIGQPGRLVAIDTANGNIKWSYPNGIHDLEDAWPTYSVNADKAGKVYFVTYDSANYPYGPPAYREAHTEDMNGKVVCVQDNGTSAALVWEKNYNSREFAMAQGFSFDAYGVMFFGQMSQVTPSGNWNSGDIYAIKKEAPAPVKPTIFDMNRGSVSITFTSVEGGSYKIESCTDPYDYANEDGMNWQEEATIPGAAVETTWTDNFPPTTGGSEKYYRVWAMSLNPVYEDLKADDTVGLMVITVQNGRNMISSPFEPYPDYSLPVEILVDIPMDAQINIGRSTSGTTGSPSGDAIYDPHGGDTIAFMSDEAEGYCRHYLDAGGAGSWAYMYVDFFLAGETDDYIDISAGGKLDFDTRFFNDPVTNTNPYGDAPVFVRLYTFDDDGSGTYPTYAGYRDYGIVYATQFGDPPYPTWTHITIDIESGTDGGTFDPARVNKLRFYNTNWSGTGDDFVDYKNLKITENYVVGKSTLNKIIGTQLTGHLFNRMFSDQIEGWDFDNNKYQRAWLNTMSNTWIDWDTSGDPKFGWNADDGYWANLVLTHGPTDVMLFGRVPKTNRSIDLKVGRNLIGTCKPVSETLAASNLVASGFTGHLFNRMFSDNIEFYKSSTASYERFWYKTMTSTWEPWEVGDPMRDFQPGDGFWINVLTLAGHADFTWDYPVP